MSRITKEEIEKTKCGRFLLSDENIYLSIYSLNSYVFEYNLLNTEDRILYHRLQDKFDARLINGVITRVREQIIELFDKDKYIEAKVYFKPKKLSENGELEFRPLHSTGLITQIAIVSMLHLFVYEIPEEEEGDPKLRLSNLSRLIPSDFYGNRVSVKPEYLFKPWKQQYQKYNQNSNDALMKYHTSLEYKYEVTLDLENFFPTINPIIIYRYIINHLPAYLNDEERKMMKRVLQKLLFCKLTTTFDEKTAGQYYKVTKGAGNYDNVDKIEQNEKECWAFKEKSDKFVRGIPQGLPQSYFLGNIYMISIAEIFRKKFTGVSYFYVDDSVIFTNDVREDNFKEQLKELNKQIADEANNFEDDSAIYPEGTEKFYKSDLYGVNVHLDGKSNYTRLDNLDDSEVYLKCISREMSQAGSDFFRMYSDEENRNLEEKLDVLSKQVKAKRDQLVEEKSQKRDSGNEDAIEKDEDDTQKFEKRLTRYYRFFEYRKQRLVAMHQPENGSDEDYKKELEKIIYSELSEEDMEDDEKILQAFMNSYGADIWDAAIGMYQTFADDKEQNVLIDDDIAYWEKGAMPYGCCEDEAEELKIIVEKLIACKRYVTAVNIIGHSECEAVINAECIYKLMKLAGTEESIGGETLDDYAVQKIIGWFQQQEDIDLELRSDIEFIYLPMLDEYSEVRPRALNTRLSLEPEYFCSLIELFYKKRNGEKREIELNKSLSDRLCEILFQFKVTPGIDWNGNFDAKRFDYWMKTVKTWSRDNDRYEAAMHTVGLGLSYAELDEDKLPQTAVIEELNRVENDELRRGYYLGTINQRGAHWVDPEGKPELELAEDYENRANIAESRGYSRYAGILRVIADEFKREAKSNILEAKNGDDE